MALRIAALLVAGLFALLALLAISQAIIVGLYQIVPPGVAWLLAALCYLLIAGLALAIVQLRHRPKRSGGLESLMPLVGKQVRKKPTQTLLLALIAGAVYEHIERRGK